MRYNYKSGGQEITSIIKIRIKPTEKDKQIKPIIYYTKFKTSNLIVKNSPNSAKTLLDQTIVVYKFIYPFRECLPKIKNPFYIGYTTTSLYCRLTYQLFAYSVIKQYLIIKHNNSPSSITSSDVSKILSENIIIIYFLKIIKMITNPRRSMHKIKKKR